MVLEPPTQKHHLDNNLEPRETRVECINQDLTETKQTKFVLRTHQRRKRTHCLRHRCCAIIVFVMPCDYLNVIFFTPEAGGGGSCYLYSYAANKPVFKISPAVDDHITTAIALRKTTKDVSTRDSAEVECDVPGDALKVRAAIFCELLDEGWTPAIRSVMTPDFAEFIMPAFLCIAAGLGNAELCLGCLQLQARDNCDAKSLCRTPDPLVIHGPCAASCIFLPGAENCVAVIEKAVLCATGARRTSYLYTDPNTFVAEIVLGGGCVNSGYDATTPRFTCPSE